MATKTLEKDDLFEVDQDDVAWTPLVVELPDSTNLTTGSKAGIMITNRTSTTTIRVKSHPDSASDVIQDPNNKTAAYLSDHATMSVDNAIVVWRLTKNVSPNTWRVWRFE